MKRILTVDDSASIRQMVSFTLRNAGYEVVEAEDNHGDYNFHYPAVVAACQARHDHR